MLRISGLAIQVDPKCFAKALCIYTGRDPKMQSISGLASLVKCPNKHLLEQAWHLLVRPLDSALSEHYTITWINFKQKYKMLCLQAPISYLRISCIEKCIAMCYNVNAITN